MPPVTVGAAPSRYTEGTWHQRLTVHCLPRRGAWVRFDLGGIDTANKARTKLRHRRTAVPPGRWEFATERNALFARYLGPEETS